MGFLWNPFRWNLWVYRKYTLSEFIIFWTMMLRTITSSPLHLLNGGIIGYFSMKFLFTKQSYKYKYLVQGFFICFISHAVYNSAGYLGGMYLVVLPLILVSNFIIVEILSALASTSKYTLDLIDLSIFEYKLIRRYTKYELWLYNEQKTEKVLSIYLNLSN